METIEKQSAIFISEAKSGETGIIRHIKSKESLFIAPEEYDTVLKIFEKNFPEYKDLEISVVNSKNSKTRTYQTIREEAINYSKNLVKLDLITNIHLDSRDWKFMGIYSKNCPEWLLTYFGHMYNDITTVSIYDSLGLDGIEHIIKLTHLKTLVIQYQFLDRIVHLHKLNKNHVLENLIVIDYEESSNNDSLIYLKENGVQVYDINDLLKEQTNNEIQLSVCKAESIVLICFTSGSTGLPKGALISHRGLTSEGMSFLDTFDIPVEPRGRHFSYLPYAHVFEQLFTVVCLCKSLNIHYYSGDIKNIAADLVQAKPSYLIAVPRVLLRFYDMLQAKFQNLPSEEKKKLDQAYAEKLDNLRKTGNYAHEIYDKAIFDKISESIFGGKLTFILTGSAPIEGKVLEFFKIIFSSPVVEGYGMTEFAGALTYTDPMDPILGHVGVPITACEYKLIDVPELNYLTTDKDQDTGALKPMGELLGRGNTNFKGYLCQQDEYKNMVDEEGWVHSGDIAILLPGNRLKIVDRRKNIFKIDKGEYVAPEKVENILKLSNLILQSWVHGISTQSYPVALIVVDNSVVKRVAAEKNISCNDPDELLTHGAIIKIYLDEIEAVCKRNGLMPFEIPKRILLTFDPFTLDNGCLTVTLKMMRNGIRKLWEEKVNKLYSDEN
jgi:long-chain acyl-CoA synthetase